MRSRSSSPRTPALLIGAAIVLFASTRAGADPLYTVTDLGYVIPQGIDSAGNVLLSSQSPTFAGGVYHSYGPLAGQMTPPSSYGATANNAAGSPPQPYVTAITGSGSILGETPVGNTWAPTIWSQGTTTQLGLPTGYSGGQAVATNASGAVVGDVNTPGGIGHAFLYQNGQMTDLGSLGGPSAFSMAAAVNSSGQVTGSADMSSTSPPHAFLYQNGQMTDLGTLGGPQSVGMAINDQGQVVGSSTLDANNTVQHAFLYSAGKMVDLGTLPGSNESEAVGINNSGTIVGDSGGHLVIWQNGSILDVNNLLKNPPGFLLSDATGINNLGQIVGVSYGPNGGYAQGFLLTPTDLPAPAAFTPVAYPAPEPGTFVVFVAMGLAYALRKRLRRKDWLS